MTSIIGIIRINNINTIHKSTRATPRAEDAASVWPATKENQQDQQDRPGDAARGRRWSEALQALGSSCSSIAPSARIRGSPSITPQQPLRDSLPRDHGSRITDYGALERESARARGARRATIRIAHCRLRRRPSITGCRCRLEKVRPSRSASDATSGCLVTRRPSYRLRFAE